MIPIRYREVSRQFALRERVFCVQRESTWAYNASNATFRHRSARRGGRRETKGKGEKVHSPRAIESPLTNSSRDDRNATLVALYYTVYIGESTTAVPHDRPLSAGHKAEMRARFFDGANQRRETDERGGATKEARVNYLSWITRSGTRAGSHASGRARARIGIAEK